MNFVEGFGDTEKRLEDNLENEFRNQVAEQYALNDDCYFTDEFTATIRKWAQGVAAESRVEGENYKQAETYPDRYSYFWCTTIGDASHIVFILKLHHINRRHGFSPDGWALMTSERIFYIDEWEARKSKRTRDAA